MTGIMQMFVGGGGAVRGCAVYCVAGTYSWVAPAGVSSVSVVAVGGGAGGGWYGGGPGGGLGYKNNYAVTAGSSYTVVVGAAGYNASKPQFAVPGDSSYFVNSTTVQGGGGPGNSATPTGGSFTGDGGGKGGGSYGGFQGGGGAGGYAGQGGAVNDVGACLNPSGGAAGGGAGRSFLVYGCCVVGAIGAGGGGGGTGLYGQGANGVNGTSPGFGCTSFGGTGGSGGGNGGNTVADVCIGGSGGFPGGGGGGGGTYYIFCPCCPPPNIRGQGATGARGAVRIVWPGNTRTFPSTDVA